MTGTFPEADFSIVPGGKHSALNSSRSTTSVVMRKTCSAGEGLAVRCPCGGTPAWVGGTPDGIIRARCSHPGLSGRWAVDDKGVFRSTARSRPPISGTRSAGAGQGEPTSSVPTGPHLRRWSPCLPYDASTLARASPGIPFSGIARHHGARRSWRFPDVCPARIEGTA